MPLPCVGAGYQPPEHLLPVAKVAEECGFAGLERQERALFDFHVNVVPSDVTGPADLERLDALGITSVQLYPFDRETATSGSLDQTLTAIGDFATRVHIN